MKRVAVVGQGRRKRRLPRRWKVEVLRKERRWRRERMLWLGVPVVLSWRRKVRGKVTGEGRVLPGSFSQAQCWWG